MKMAASSPTGMHAMCPGFSGTIPDFDTLSQCPRKYEIVLEILRNKVD